MKKDDDLSGRLQRCIHFKWVNGIRYRKSPAHMWWYYDACEFVGIDGETVRFTPGQGNEVEIDMNDAATKGAILGLLRQVSGDEGMQVTWLPGQSEAEALVRALEACPFPSTPG